uniref:WYL domain-containing protein n=1 Tax=Petrachloros mirabilis TaxID=2918835 RepID=UPI0030844260
MPHWVVTADYEFKRWILGFGAQVKVYAPVELAQDLQAMAQAIAAIYPVDDS